MPALRGRRRSGSSRRPAELGGSLRLRAVTSASAVAATQDLFAEYMRWTLTLGVDPRDAPTFEGFDAELRSLPGVYGPPGGLLLLATIDRRPVGCIALRRLDATTAELKRLYVRPAARGSGVGRRLVRRLLEAAEAAGYDRVVLDSHISMRSAHRIYREAGFRDVGAPPGFPEKLRPVVVFMEWSRPAGG